MVLAGAAEETTKFQGSQLHQVLYLIPLRPLSDEEVRPDLSSTVERRVYGAFEGAGWASSGLTHIVGTSGGPVFGIWFSEDCKTFDYAAIGVQSGWHQSAKQIAASPLDEVAASLTDAISGTGNSGA